MDFQLPDGSSIRLVAPFIDMANHSSEIGQCHVYDTSSGGLSIIAGQDYEVDDQVSRPRFLVNASTYLGRILLDFHLLWIYSQ